jgi:multiple sugar transport system permease protein
MTPSQIQAVTPATRGRGMTDTQFALTIVSGVILFHALVVLMPLFYSFWLSLHETDIILRTAVFVGGGNYADLVSRPEIAKALKVSILFSFVSVALSLILGLLMALVLNEEFWGRGLLRAIVLLPWAISEVATATMVIFLVNPTFGVLNGIFELLGLPMGTIDWMSPDRAILWVALAFVWHIAPLGAFFFLAALQTVPRDLYRAAKIDRAGVLARFRYVTLPHIRYAVLIVLVVVTVEAFREFDLVFALTQGGPGTSTQILSLLIFRYNFQISQYGLASAASYILVVVTIILATGYFVVLTYRKSDTTAAIRKSAAEGSGQT